jgi:dTDP-L-rhamnose 4-epimerase
VNMSESVLVTGGAGFIGSHLVDGLLQAGYTVRVLDNLEPQVHGRLGETRMPPEYLNPEAEFVYGDVRDPETVARALEGIDVVFHEAARVGVGQSMYEIDRYTDGNVNGAAVVLQAIVNSKRRPRKMIVASSMSIYGEGAYHCAIHGAVYPKLRSAAQLAARDWEMVCPMAGCGLRVRSVPTAENKPLQPTSIYAINKRDHEEMFLAIGAAYNIPVVALRYFNTYGTRQALSNPYTGVAAIFSSRMLNNNPPVIYEDGKQSRDFVHVRDIVQANLLVMNDMRADHRVFNVGTGRSVSIEEVATILLAHFEKNAHLSTLSKFDVQACQPEITQKFRAGDTRHCFPDIRQLCELGYAPTVRLEEGVTELVDWIVRQTPADHFDQARNELNRRGLSF